MQKIESLASLSDIRRMEAADQSMIIDGSALTIAWKDAGDDYAMMHVIWHCNLYCETFVKSNTKSLNDARGAIKYAKAHDDVITIYMENGSIVHATKPRPDLVTGGLPDFEIEIVHGYLYLRGYNHLYGKILLSHETQESLRNMLIQSISESMCDYTIIAQHANVKYHLGVVDKHA